MAKDADPRSEELLRPALELAFLVAAFGARQKPEVEPPLTLKPFVRAHRLPDEAVPLVRQAIEDDVAFRERVALAADDASVGKAGALWLRRPNGWQESLTRLEAGEDVAAPTTSGGGKTVDKAAVRRAESAERELRRVRAELSVVAANLARRERADRESESVLRKVERSRAELDGEVKRLRNKLETAAEAQKSLDALLAQERRRVRELEAEVASVRREMDASIERAAVSTAIESARRALEEAAEALGRRPTTKKAAPPRRERLVLPRGLVADTPDGFHHLIALDGVEVVIDGYNASMAGWPVDDLPTQRSRLTDLLSGMRRQRGLRARVVFDAAAVGADRVGPPGRSPAGLTVEFSAAGQLADDLIVERVQAVPHDRPVVVVTSDAELRRRCERLGAVTVSSATLLGSR